MNAWRDVDNDRRYLGLTVSARGLSLNLGHRLYRVRWS